MSGWFSHETLAGRFGEFEKHLVEIIELLGVIINDQEHLNADVAALAAVLSAVTDDLKNQNAAAGKPLDFSGLDSLVSQFQAALTPATAAAPAPPAEPAPVEAAPEPPAAPVEPSAPADATPVAETPAEAPVADSAPVADTAVAAAAP